MGLFDKIKGPIFLKKEGSAPAQLTALQDLQRSAPSNISALIERDIRAVRAGISGENNILFELENSHIPMLIIHDLCLNYKGYAAQIDYMIFTRKRQFIVECKNLYGNIEINQAGDFIRTITYNGKFYQEGIYSPITQNQRHLELIKQIRSDEKGNPILKSMFEKSFYENYRSIVVLANPKTILHSQYAPKAIKERVIRADGLTAYIQNVNNEPDAFPMQEKGMEELAAFFLKLHKPPNTDYTAKYRELIAQAVSKQKLFPPTGITPQPSFSTEPRCPKCGAPMIKRTAVRGANAGQEFYGCSNYPSCRGTINISPNTFKPT